MATPKTIETNNSVKAFMNTVADEQKRKESFRLVEMMKEQSGFEPKMWGPAIVGFGSYHYKYESGHEGDAPLVAFSPRKAAISLYLSGSFAGREKLLKKLGRHKASKACIYIKKLEDLDAEVLKEMISLSIGHVMNMYK